MTLPVTTMMETKDTELWTMGGAKIDFANPQRDMIDMSSIAISLANQSRFNGYTNGYYSIAQHSTIMSYWAEDLYESNNLPLARAALLHDAGESWVGEVVTPIKRKIPAFGGYENNVTRMIFEDHGLDPDMWDCDEIKELDAIMFNTEVRDLKDRYAPPEPHLCIPDDQVIINPQLPPAAYDNFILRYNTLFPERKITRPYITF